MGSIGTARTRASIVMVTGLVILATAAAALAGHDASSCTNDALLATYADSAADSVQCFADDGSYKVSGRIFDKDNG